VKPAASPMRPRSRLIGFFGLSLSNKLVLVESLVTLALVSIAIRIAPFRAVVKAASSRRRTKPASTPAARAAVARCRWAVEKWGDRVPWRTVCFQKGLALHMMLRRRGIASVLHYGVMQNAARGLAAHVWISEGDRLVLGGEIASDYTELARFPPPDPTKPSCGPEK
jgi:hypothetical protein